MCASVCGGSAESGIIFVLLFFCIPLATFVLIGLFNCMFRGGCNGNEGKTYVNKRAIDRRLERASNGFYVGDLDHNPPEDSNEVFDRIDEIPPIGMSIRPEYRIEKNESIESGGPEYVLIKNDAYHNNITLSMESTVPNVIITEPAKKREHIFSESAPFIIELEERIKKRAVMLSTLKDIESGKVALNEIIGNRERVLVLAKKSS